MKGPRAKRSTVLDEARETSGVTSAVLLTYLDHVGGPQAVADVLRRCGLQACEEELRDETSWISWETTIELFKATAAVLDKPGFLREMVEFGMRSRVPHSLKVALRTLGSPELLLRNIAAVTARFDRVHVPELLSLQRGRATLRFSDIDAERPPSLDCDYVAALLVAVPTLFGLPPGRVSHTQCAAAGADVCTFDLRWRVGVRELLGRSRGTDRRLGDSGQAAQRWLASLGDERSLAARDPVTGLLDHDSFVEALEAELERCAQEEFYSAVMLIDLGGSDVNGEDGQRDQLLRAAARALSDVSRRVDLAFRLSEDRLALLLSRVTEDQALKIADRVCAAINMVDPRLSAAAAVAVASPGSTDSDALIAEAVRRLDAAAPGSRSHA